ncbi:MAG TPA: hypothetical protein VE178_17260 [Silvibacterium sp.]|nr:hypothetical protein [Silvibacterium sp.]
MFPAVTSAFKVAVATFTVSGLVAPWIIQTGATVLIATTAVTFVTISAKAVEKAKKEPFAWTIAVLALWNPFIADLCKELYKGSPFQKIAFKAAMIASFSMAAVLWKRGDPWTRVVAMLLFLFSPTLMMALSLHSSMIDSRLPLSPASVLTALSQIPLSTAASIVGALVLIGLAVITDRFFERAH